VDSAQLEALFPAFSTPLRDAMLAAGISRSIPANTVIYEEGHPCDVVPFILRGQVRVYKIGESGREITLYRVSLGQTCVLSSSCGMSGTNYPAIAEAEEDVELLAIPVREFNRLAQKFPELQAFVNRTLSERLAELMLVVEEVAFRRVDLRLAEFLAQASQADGEQSLSRTHAQLAVELGTAREVVSRILKDFERHGYVQLGRGRIDVTNRDALIHYRDAIASQN
jgi:CRP/FNR family transcriptional regulator